jgi:hypothetical protein
MSVCEENPESSERALNRDPTDKPEPKEPTEQIKRTEPIEPIESTEPLDPILRIDCFDPIDHKDLRAPMAGMVFGATAVDKVGWIGESWGGARMRRPRPRTRQWATTVNELGHRRPDLYRDSDLSRAA